MIAYSRHELTQLEIRSVVLDAASQELITREETAALLNKFPSRFYSPNIYIRIGLGILTMVCISSISSIFGLLLDFRNAEIILLLTALGCFSLLEYFIQSKYHYRSGIDDTLLHTGIACLLIFIGIQTENHGRLDDTIISLSAIVFYTFTALRYLDRLALIGALVSIAFFSFSIWEHSLADMALYPCWTLAFILSAIAVIAHKQKDNKATSFHRHLLLLLENLAALGAYASLHIITIDTVLREYTRTNAANSLHPAATILYWTWTLVIPALMLRYALRKRESLSIRLSLLAILSVLYAQHLFYPLFEQEVAAVIYGSLLLLAGWMVIRYLKQESSVYSFRHGGDKGDLLGQNPFLVVAGFADTGQDAPATTDTRFGGGSFGGAGAGSEF